MDASQESGTTSEDESLDARLSRLNQNFSQTLEAARRAQTATDDYVEEFKPRPSLPAASHTLSLRFPAAATYPTAFTFEDDRYSDDPQYSYESESSAASDVASRRVERVCMKLEDALGRLAQVTAPQRLLLTEQELATLSTGLSSMSPGEERVVLLGTAEFVIKQVESTEDLAVQYSNILEATEAIYSEEMTSVENPVQEMVVAAEAPAEEDLEEKDEGRDTKQEIDWEARMEEYQSAWDLLLEQRRDVEIREAMIAGREEALKTQYALLEKGLREVESAKVAQEAKALKWSEELLSLKHELEALVLKATEETLKARECVEDLQQKQRRQTLEKDIKPMREQALELISSGYADGDLASYLDQAEDALIDAVRSGKSAKYKIRLSALRTKLASAKTHMEILRHKNKAAALNTTLDVIGTQTNYERSKANVQHRLMSSYSVRSVRSTSPRSVRMGSPSPRVLSPSQSVASEEWLMTRSMSTLAGRLSSMSRGSQEAGNYRLSPSPDLEERLVVPASPQFLLPPKQLIDICETRVDKWRTLAFQLLSQVQAWEVKDKQISQTEGQCRAWERRLMVIEKELKSREVTVRDREVAISRTEDNLLILAGKHLTASEARRLLDTATAETQKKKAELETIRNEVATYKAAIDAEQLMLQEKTKFVETQWKDVRSGQVRLEKGAATIDGILRSLHQFLFRLSQ